MSGLSVLSGKFYLYIYLPIYHIIYHCHFSSICVFMYIIYIYIYVYVSTVCCTSTCSYIICSIKLGISPNKNSMTSIYDFYDVHLLGPYTLAVPVFYRPVWFCVKTMKLRHTMSPAPPQKNNAISKHRELILDFNPPEEYAPHITQIWLEKK